MQKVYFSTLPPSPTEIRTVLYVMPVLTGMCTFRNKLIYDGTNLQYEDNKWVCKKIISQQNEC